MLLSPSGAYYESGLKPVPIYVEEEFVRAVRGGTGFAKTGGNYASSLRAQTVAHEKGYSQVLWLDGIEKKYVGEVGAMNIFFVIDGEVITPELDGSILPGITRMSMVRPITLWPFPTETVHDAIAQDSVKACLTVEMSDGQMFEDIRLAVNGCKPCEFMGKAGSIIPSAEEIAERIMKMREA